MKKQLFIFFFLFSIQFGYSQVDLAQRELLLNSKLEALRAVTNDDEIETLIFIGRLCRTEVSRN